MNATYIEVSAKDGTNIDVALLVCMNQILKAPDEIFEKPKELDPIQGTGSCC